MLPSVPNQRTCLYSGVTKVTTFTSVAATPSTLVILQGPRAVRSRITQRFEIPR